ncbi:DUF2868 domain-containing protein [Rhabdochromatium marinum]|uniref:DUF2868 domain-containing protein n=1 Tax=Rhabdochromatium marinum TaxID=48729 RepID=UPI0019089C07|nr:DUF2868 domain-containing protein [Rhabdochromatium marinum]MBK1648678.1 cell division protein [Rhabdochromatium marinum]
MTFFRTTALSAESSQGDTAPFPRWEVPDLIDFDYYVEADEHAEQDTLVERQSLAKRDRSIYLERVKPHIQAAEHTAEHRRSALRLWLAECRRTEDPALRPLLPGASFARGQRVVTILLTVLGLITGGAVASALLQYDGVRPVNVSWFLFVLVFLQLGLAGFTLGAWFMRRSKSMQQALRDVSLLAHLIRPLFSRVAQWIQRHRLGQMPPEVRERAKSRQGLLQSHFSLYGPASYLPMLIPVQAFGIGFNLGAILVTLLLVWFSDLAFGWGSALNVDPAVIYHLTKAVAWPWSDLFGEGVGYPTLAEVAGTRINLKDPLYLLNAEHLRAWRWFLLLALICYGLLPRLLLLGLSAFSQRQALNRLPFTHQRTQALYTRLVTPELDTGLGRTGTGPEMPIPGPLTPVTAARAAPTSTPPEVPVTDEAAQSTPPPTAKPADKSVEAPVEKLADKPADISTDTPAKELVKQATGKPVAKPTGKPVAKPTAKPVATPAPTTSSPPHRAISKQPAQDKAPQDQARIAPDACILLLHVDVADVLEEADHGRLQQLLRQCSGWRVARSATYGGGSAMADQAIALITDSLWEAPPPRIALVDDGSQPPITESLSFLRRVRAAAGDQAQMLISLIGDPEGEDEDDPLPPVTAFDFSDWQRKIEQLADPYLRLTSLVAAAADDDTEER